MLIETSGLGFIDGILDVVGAIVNILGDGALETMGAFVVGLLGVIGILNVQEQG
jgi:hypothetical protein